MSTPAQIAANQKNAQLSTGPITGHGKAKSSSNLSIQESRLSRQREKDLAELKQLQQERLAKREVRLNAAAHMYERFKENKDPFNPVEFGFEFSFDEIEGRCGVFEGRRIRCE